MAGKSDAYELDILKLLFNATAIPLIADNTATTPLTSLYVSLHTADPLTGGTEVGTQTTSEATYTGYARVAVARTSGGWTCATAAGVSTAKPVAAITFPACTGGSSAVTHFAIGSLTTAGAGKIFYAGAVAPTITVTNGITPQLSVATQISED